MKFNNHEKIYLKRSSLRLSAILLLLFCCIGGMIQSICAQANPESNARSGRELPPITVADAFTPVVARVIGPPTFFVRGIDGKYHFAYDIEFQNARLAPATLQKVEVIDAFDTSKVLVSISGDELVRRFRTLAARPVEDAGIEPNGGRVLFIELTTDSLAQTPKAVIHRLTLLGAANPAATIPSQLE